VDTAKLEYSASENSMPEMLLKCKPGPRGVDSVRTVDNGDRQVEHSTIHWRGRRGLSGGS